MKKILQLVLLLICPMLAQMRGQTASPQSGPITSNQCVSIATGGYGVVAIHVTGTWTGTLQPQVYIVASSPGNTQVTPSTNSSAPQPTITANGTYQTVSVSGFPYFQVCGNTVGSGTATVNLEGAVQSGGIHGTGNTKLNVLFTNAFAGADAGTRAQNCFSYLANNFFYNFGACSLENESTVDMAVDPFCGNTSYGASYSPNNPILILSGQALNKIEVPLTKAGGGCTYQTYVPGHASIIGPYVGIGETGTDDLNGVFGGATLTPGASWPSAGSTTSPLAGGLTLSGTVSAYVDDGSTTGSHCGYTFPITPPGTGTGLVCVIGISTNFNTQLAVGGMMCIPYNCGSTSNAIIGRIETISSATQLVLSMQYGAETAGVPLTGATYSVYYPAINFGMRGQHYNGKVNQGGYVAHLTIDMDGVPGGVCIANYAAAEMNRITDTKCTGFALAGIIAEGNTVQDFSMDHVMLSPNGGSSPGSGICTANTIDFLNNGTGMQGISDSIFAGAQSCGGSGTQDIGIQWMGVEGQVADNHFEQKNPAVNVSAAITCASYPCVPFIHQSNTGQVHNLRIVRNDLGCALGGGGCTNGIVLGNSYGTPYDITIENFVTGSGTTNSLLDDNNSNTLTTTNNAEITTYILDSNPIGGKVSFTNANPADPLTNVAIDAYAGAVTTGTITAPAITVSTAANSAATPLSVSQGAPSSVFPTAALNITQGANTGATNVPALNVASTWNGASIAGPLISISVTDTSSTGTALLQEWFAGSSGNTAEAAIDIAGNFASSGVYGALTAGANATFKGGTQAAANTNGAGGGAIYQGNDNSNNGSSTKGGYAILRGGELTNATPNAAALEGVSQVGSGYLKGSAIAAVGDIVCGTTTAFTVTDCPHSTIANNIIGIASSTSNPIGVVSYGLALVSLDGALTNIGDNVCMSTTTDGKGHDNGSTTTACTLGETIGVIVADSGTITQMSGSTTAATAMSTTLPLVQLHISQ